MGSVCDMSDIERVLRSTRGKAMMKEFEAMLVGRKIVGIDFGNDIQRITMTIGLDRGSIDVTMPEWDIDVLRENFDDEINEEYYKDYPERKPK